MRIFVTLTFLHIGSKTGYALENLLVVSDATEQELAMYQMHNFFRTTDPAWWYYAEYYPSMYRIYIKNLNDLQSPVLVPEHFVFNCVYLYYYRDRMSISPYKGLGVYSTIFFTGVAVGYIVTKALI